LKYLLDTHVILWLLDDYEKLSNKAFEIISSNEINCYFSKASLFEISIKKNILKLNLNYTIEGLVSELLIQNFEVLDISTKHLDYYINLPIFENHKDPFDRLLISTAAVENLTILSIDEKFKNYKDLVQTIW
jgi:PIN domain nuclease of toxin-antitoxin system